MLSITSNQLRAARALIGSPSLRELSQVLGLSFATLQRMESAASPPALSARAKTLGRLVSFLEDRGIRFANHDGVAVVAALQPAQPLAGGR